MKSNTLRGLLAGLAAMAVAAAVPTPAHAACVELDLAIHYKDGPDYYPLGPDKCVKDTPWNQTDRVWVDDSHSGAPSGVPNGIYFELWYTSP